MHVLERFFIQTISNKHTKSVYLSHIILNKQMIQMLRLCFDFNKVGYFNWKILENMTFFSEPICQNIKYISRVCAK